MKIMRRRDRVKVAVMQALSTILDRDKERYYIHPELERELITSLLDIAVAHGETVAEKRILREYLS